MKPCAPDITQNIYLGGLLHDGGNVPYAPQISDFGGLLHDGGYVPCAPQISDFGGSCSMIGVMYHVHHRYILWWAMLHDWGNVPCAPHLVGHAPWWDKPSTTMYTTDMTLVGHAPW